MLTCKFLILCSWQSISSRFLEERILLRGGLYSVLVQTFFMLDPLTECGSTYHSSPIELLLKKIHSAQTGPAHKISSVASSFFIVHLISSQKPKFLVGGGRKGVPQLKGYDPMQFPSSRGNIARGSEMRLLSGF